MTDIKPWAHQDQAREKARPLPGYGLFFEMGTGKTRTAIDIAREYMNWKRALARILIFTPPMVVPQWKDEWKKFSKLDPRHVTLLQGSGKKRLATFNMKAWEPGEVPRPAPGIFVSNYEALLLGGYRDKEKVGHPYVPGELYQAMLNWRPELIIYDESHRLKNHEAIRSQQAYHLANPWNKKERCPEPKPKTLVLSGSPVLNNPLDIFMQFKVMLGGFPTPAYIDEFMTTGVYNPRHLITNYYHFRSRYFRDKNAGMGKENHFADWQPMTLEKHGFDALAEIQKYIEMFSMRVTKDECLDLPDEVPVLMEVGMSAEQARVYREMKTQLVAYMNDKTCVATMALTKALRMLQITSGFVSLQGLGEEDDKADVRFDKTPKDEALRELLEEITPHSKVLVWAVWKENYAQIRKICDELGIGYVEAHGGISDAKKNINVNKFKEDPSKRVFIGHPGSGGVGLNLVVAPYSIFYSRTFSLEHYLQARARNHRGGQTMKVTHYDLVCHNTIDALALEKVAHKIEVSAKMLGDIAKELATQASSD